MLPVIFLGGATVNGRAVGFSSALLEEAPAGERPTYSALDAVLILPIGFLPLVAGVFLQHWSYPALFLLTAGFVGLEAVLTGRLPPRSQEQLHAPSVSAGLRAATGNGEVEGRK